MVLLRQVMLNNLLFKSHLKVMRYCGLVVFDDQRFHSMHKFRGYLSMFIWSTFIVTQFIDLIQAFGDIGRMATNAAFTLLVTIVLSQCYEFLYYRSDLMTTLLNEIDANMNKINNFDGDEKHRKIIMKFLAINIRNSNLLTAVYYISAGATVAMMCFFGFWKYLHVVDLSTEERNKVNWLMIKSWYPIDTYEYFIPIYIHQVINCILGLILSPLIWTLIVAFMCYAVSMLQILKYRCETITDGIEGIPSMDDRDRILKQKLVECVGIQLEVGRFVHNLDTLINLSMFVIFVIISLLMCSLLYQISVSEFSAEVLIQCFFICNMFVILLMFYWHANEIAYHSSDLSNSIYLSDWYKGSKQFKEIMMIFMIGSQRPMTLSALYFTMNLDVFISILKASYSYYTLLSHMSVID